MLRSPDILLLFSAISVFCISLPASSKQVTLVKGGSSGGSGSPNGNGGSGGGNGPASGIVAGSCVSVTDIHGCLFNGNIAPSTYAVTQTAYNLYNDTHASAAPDITLVPLFKSDDAAFHGSLTGGNSATGTWSTPGFAVSFLAVKAADYFVLYEFAAPVSSGNWTTLEIPHKNELHALSHLAFFGATIPAGGGNPPAVPEPASWALMLGGFGVVGGLMRRRRPAVSLA